MFADKKLILLELYGVVTENTDVNNLKILEKIFFRCNESKLSMCYMFKVSFAIMVSYCD